MTCPQPSMTVRIDLTALLRRVAHGVHHMRPTDLAIRAVLLVGCLAVTVWMIHSGELVWPLVVGAAGIFEFQAVIGADPAHQVAGAVHAFAGVPVGVGDEAHGSEIGAAVVAAR